jgi:hypothetical protein
MRPDIPPVFSRLSNRGESIGSVSGLCTRGAFSLPQTGPLSYYPRSPTYSVSRLLVFLFFLPFFAKRFWVAGTGGSGSDVSIIFSLTQ